MGARNHQAKSNGKTASPVRVPEMPRAVAAAMAEQIAYRAEREAAERRGQVRALVMIAVVVLLVSMMRAGWERVFYAGWWWQW